MTKVIYANDPRPRRNRRRRKAEPKRSVRSLIRGLCVVAVVGVVAILLARASVGTIRVQNASVVDLAATEAQLRSYLGAPLFFVDSDALRAPLLADPWVIDVDLHRRLPGTLIVAVSEARPMFRLSDGCAVDDRARVLPRRDGIDLKALPLLRATHDSEHRIDEALADQVRELASVMSRLPWDFGGRVAEIEFAGRQMTIHRADGAGFLLASDAIERGLTRWAAVRDRLAPGPQDRVDLRFQRQIVLARADGTNSGGTTWKR